MQYICVDYKLPSASSEMSMFLLKVLAYREDCRLTAVLKL